MAEFLLILEIIGTVAFAVSGAMTGLSKKMDIFGVVILGLTTAVGGGMIRDLVLGLTPPAMFTNPIYAAVAAVVSVIVFLPAVRRWLTAYGRVREILMLVMDSLGLGVFTVVGIQRAYTATEHRGLFLLVFVGVVSGVGGRDGRTNALHLRQARVRQRVDYRCDSLRCFVGALGCHDGHDSGRIRDPCDPPVGGALSLEPAQSVGKK